MKSAKLCWVLTGASGWFGRTALWEYEKLFGPEALRQEVLPFASRVKSIDFGSPMGPIQAVSLDDLDRIQHASGLIHLAFLTRDRLPVIGVERYIQINRAITARIENFLHHNPTIPIITASSGAAAALDGLSGDLTGDPYGTLKQEEEVVWRRSAESRMAVAFRVYAASGRFIKDPSLFALGDFLQQAQMGNSITVRSPRPVIRSYVHVGTLMRLAWLMLLRPLNAGYRQIDAVTHTISLQELAACISRHWGLPPVQSSVNASLMPDRYVADPAKFIELLRFYELKTPSLLDQIIETASSLPCM